MIILTPCCPQLEGLLGHEHLRETISTICTCQTDDDHVLQMDLSGWRHLAAYIISLPRINSFTCCKPIFMQPHFYFRMSFSTAAPAPPPPPIPPWPSPSSPVSRTGRLAGCAASQWQTTPTWYFRQRDAKTGTTATGTQMKGRTQ
jgi:hypothetical protein